MTLITYVDTAEAVTPDRLSGFFVGWPDPPTPETHLRLLRASSLVVLALDGPAGPVVGFLSALSDGVLSAYLPLLEVLPAYQKRGIGGALVRRMLARLAHLYMVDVSCDPELAAFYAGFGFAPAGGMTIRRYQYQSGVPTPPERTRP